MKHVTLTAVLATAVLCGCSGASGLTTASVSGSGATATAPAAPTHDVTSRALQVGTTAARATKCGYNFDPAKLKANFLAAEAKINPADVPKAEQVYTVANNGIVRAVATKADYCTPSKTAEIKEDLTRHLAGDYSPRPPKVEQQEPGFWDKVGDGNANDSKFGTEDWWESQKDKKGG